jgi:hypothetical protein
MLEITDCPHRVGTPEHGEWVRTVFIPAVRAERTRLDRARFGAPSIGGRATDGGMLRLFVPVHAPTTCGSMAHPCDHVEEHLAYLADGVLDKIA